MVFGISKGSKLQIKARASQAQKRTILVDGRETKKTNISNIASDFYESKNDLGFIDL